MSAGRTCDIASRSLFSLAVNAAASFLVRVRVMVRVRVRVRVRVQLGGEGRRLVPVLRV